MWLEGQNRELGFLEKMYKALQAIFLNQQLDKASTATQEVLLPGQHRQAETLYGHCLLPQRRIKPSRCACFTFLSELLTIQLLLDRFVFTSYNMKITAFLLGYLACLVVASPASMQQKPLSSTYDDIIQAGYKTAYLLDSKNYTALGEWYNLREPPR